MLHIGALYTPAVAKLYLQVSDCIDHYGKDCSYCIQWVINVQILAADISIYVLSGASLCVKRNRITPSELHEACGFLSIHQELTDNEHDEHNLDTQAILLVMFYLQVQSLSRR